MIEPGEVSEMGQVMQAKNTRGREKRFGKCPGGEGHEEVQGGDEAPIQVPKLNTLSDIAVPLLKFFCL